MQERWVSEKHRTAKCDVFVAVETRSRGHLTDG